MTDGMLRVVYLSVATRPLADDERAALLDVARRNNEALGITGVLTRYDGAYLQVLEGPAEAVQAIFGRITTDRRHTGLLVLQRTAITERVFASWAMAWVDHARLVRTGFDLGTFDHENASSATIRAMLDAFARAVAKAG